MFRSRRSFCAYLKQTDESLHWKTLALTGFARTKREAFFFDGEFWRHAAAGSIVFGFVVARRELELVTMGDEAAERRGRGERIKAKMDSGL